tara:strand:+ start:324 stop:500 length:177 start_codon:yes stop_codon:yes gene_type:complete
MGLIKAVLVLVISIAITNFLVVRKEQFRNVPFLGTLLASREFYCYSLVTIITLINLLL